MIPEDVSMDVVRAAIDGEMSRWVGPWVREQVARAVLAAALPVHDQRLRWEVEQDGRRFAANPLIWCGTCRQQMPINHAHNSEAAPDAPGAAPDPHERNHRD